MRNAQFAIRNTQYVALRTSPLAPFLLTHYALRIANLRQSPLPRPASAPYLPTMSRRVRPWLFGLEGFIAIGGLAAGLMMILNPGEGVSMGDDVLADLGYHSWRAPGWFLFGLIGVFPTAVIVAEVRRHRLASLGHLGVGLVLIGWIFVQVTRTGWISWLQPTMLAIGVLVAALSWIGDRAGVIRALSAGT